MESSGLHPSHLPVAVVEALESTHAASSNEKTLVTVGANFKGCECVGVGRGEVGGTIACSRGSLHGGSRVEHCLTASP